uniref:Ribonucleotide reductase regulatory subunit M2 n=1 Tax=Pongo abelii TaxID=9601 RepID=A0A8I5TUQ7_PONAB
MESRPSGRQHASGGDGDQSPTQCAGMRSSGRSDQPYVLRGNPLLLCVRCYSGCASGSGRQLQLSVFQDLNQFSHCRVWRSPALSVKGEPPWCSQQDPQSPFWAGTPLERPCFSMKLSGWELTKNAQRALGSKLQHILSLNSTQPCAGGPTILRPPRAP